MDLKRLLRNPAMGYLSTHNDYHDYNFQRMTSQISLLSQ